MNTLLESPLSTTQSKGVGIFLGRLQSWNFALVRRYTLERGIYTPDEVEIAEIEYQRYLALVLAYPEQILPISAQLDDFWHTHILFTKDYHAMCHQVCGRYIHHTPTMDKPDRDNLATKYSDTLRLYTQEFGAPTSAFWPLAAQMCAGGGGSGCTGGSCLSE